MVAPCLTNCVDVYCFYAEFHLCLCVVNVLSDNLFDLMVLIVLINVDFSRNTRHIVKFTVAWRILDAFSEFCWFYHRSAFVFSILLCGPSQEADATSIAFIWDKHCIWHIVAKVNQFAKLKTT